MKTITKEITILNAVNLVAYYKKIRENEKEKDKFNVFSVGTQWHLKKNMDILASATASYEEFRAEKQQEINDRYFSDQYSDPTVIKKMVDGEEKEFKGRQVKSEYMDEYKEANLKLGEELFKLASEKVSVQIYPIDLDAEIDTLDKQDNANTANLTMDDLDFLNFFQE